MMNSYRFVAFLLVKTAKFVKSTFLKITLSFSNRGMWALSSPLKEDAVATILSDKEA
jgi:hypothetical protein